MGSFLKGLTFTMDGKEYVVLEEGTDDPSSCLVYAPRYEKETADPLTIRRWKAEAKLARGDIMISGYLDETKTRDSREIFYPPALDPLEQIAELKRQILAIEQRRLALHKARDPKGAILLQDNLIRPNKTFDVWSFAAPALDNLKSSSAIQYIKIRSLLLALSGEHCVEHFLFDVSEQFHPAHRIRGDVMSTEGRLSLALSSSMKTVQGKRSALLTDELEGKLELLIELRQQCKLDSGMLTVDAKIIQAAYIREVNAPGLKIGNLPFPEIGDHLIAIEGITIDIYTKEPVCRANP